MTDQALIKSLKTEKVLLQREVAKWRRFADSSYELIATVKPNPKKTTWHQTYQELTGKERP